MFTKINAALSLVNLTSSSVESDKQALLSQHHNETQNRHATQQCRYTSWIELASLQFYPNL